MDKWMDEWMDGWISGWMNGWIDGWIRGRVNKGKWKKMRTLMTLRHVLFLFENGDEN